MASNNLNSLNGPDCFNQTTTTTACIPAPPGPFIPPCEETIDARCIIFPEVDEEDEEKKEILECYGLPSDADLEDIINLILEKSIK